jgi:hypothetical protein
MTLPPAVSRGESQYCVMLSLRCGKARAHGCGRNECSGNFAVCSHLLCNGAACLRGRMHEYEDEGDEAERCDGQDVVEHIGLPPGRLDIRLDIPLFPSRITMRFGRRKEERPAAIKFACGILRVAQIEDCYSFIRAFADAVVLVPTRHKYLKASYSGPARRMRDEP